MRVNNETVEASYERQRHSSQEPYMPSCYFAPNSIDNWRHNRMRSHADGLLTAFPGASWLTVGDGTYGSDAHYLQSRGAKAIASSLVDTSLAEAVNRGWIKDYRAINAEAINMPDDSVDFVFCKEALHHLPRPSLGLYEMLRVARRGVVLIEPQDQPRPLDGLRSFAKRHLRNDTSLEFEEAGNYIYRLSVREVEKQLLAMGGQWLAYRRFNDFYLSKLACVDHKKQPSSLATTKLAIAAQNLLCHSGLMGWGLCCLVATKGVPDAKVVSALAATGFKNVDLPLNPYKSGT